MLLSRRKSPTQRHLSRNNDNVPLQQLRKKIPPRTKIPPMVFSFFNKNSRLIQLLLLMAKKWRRSFYMITVDYIMVFTNFFPFFSQIFTCLWFSTPIWTPLTSIMRSPGLSPASSAGDPASTLPINWPVFTLPANKLKPNPSKSGRLITWQRRGAGASGGIASIVDCCEFCEYGAMVDDVKPPRNSKIPQSNRIIQNSLASRPQNKILTQLIKRLKFTFFHEIMKQNNKIPPTAEIKPDCPPTSLDCNWLPTEPVSYFLSYQRAGNEWIVFSLSPPLFFSLSLTLFSFDSLSTSQKIKIKWKPHKTVYYQRTFLVFTCPPSIFLFILPLEKKTNLLLLFIQLVSWVKHFSRWTISCWTFYNDLLIVWKNKQKPNDWMQCVYSRHIAAASLCAIYISLLSSSPPFYFLFFHNERQWGWRWIATPSSGQE